VEPENSGNNTQREPSIKHFTEWCVDVQREFESYSSVTMAERSWYYQDKQWRHRLANVQTANNLKIQVLERKLKDALAYEMVAHQKHEEAQKIIETQKGVIAHQHERILEADVVIRFYASNNWNSVAHKDGPVFHAEELGGNRAREYIKKWEIK
jgi:hypothetical protein